MPDPDAREVIHLINVDAPNLAAAVGEAYLVQRPQDARERNAAARQNYVHDTMGQLRFLSEALAMGQPILFAHQVGWERTWRQKRNLSTESLEANLLCIIAAIERRVSPSAGVLCRSYIEAARARLHYPSKGGPAVANSGPLSQLRKMYLDALLRAARGEAASIIMRALDAGADIRDIYLRVFQAAQYEVGRLWHMNEINIAQAHYCTAVTQSIISRLYPRVFAAEPNGRRLVATCADGEQHEIGIRMVSDFFEMEGWDTCYLGAGTPARNVVRAIDEKRADLVLVSVTMALNLSKAQHLIELIRGSNASAGAKVLVGGYTCNIVPDLWKKMGADGYARDADAAVGAARSLFEGHSAIRRVADQAP